MTETRIAYQENGCWLYERLAGRDATLILASIGTSVTLEDIYDRVDV